MGFSGRRKKAAWVLGYATVCCGIFLFAQEAEERENSDAERDVALHIAHPECAFFGSRRQSWTKAALEAAQPNLHWRSALTERVVSMLGTAQLAADAPAPTPSSANIIDRYLFEEMAKAGVAPAPRTGDFEFIRRVTLDLTGRIPTSERALQFAADVNADKRAQLVDELLASPAWVDKWTMFFGDLFNNTANTAQVRRFTDGRNAFYQWIRRSLAENKPYNQMATELIASQGTNSYDPEQGQINWLVGGFVTGGPVQDTYDQQAANVAETFLGIAHLNCILCHNGRGHLDSLSLWGRSATRVDAWGLAAFFAKTQLTRVNVEGQRNVYYWTVGPARTPRDYTLGTTSGNRPPRCANGLPLQPNGRCAAAGAITPRYPFTGETPNPGEDYRAALARFVTRDFQFARATVNYIWAHFFVRGLVEPINQFDPARLDPSSPPPAPWTLQPSNPRLLNALAQEFINSGYNLKTLMRQITLSEAYQLSSRYPGDWDAKNERLFARKLVRRLWAEEIHDSVALASGLLPSYNIAGIGRVNWAMQLPEPRSLPDGPNGPVTRFLDAFLRGNRDEEERRDDTSVSQALALMNDNFVLSRIRSTTSSGNSSLLRRVLAYPPGWGDQQLVDALYLAVLSRRPTTEEVRIAVDSLRSGNREQKAENLLWALFNKVDFLYNY